MSTDVLTGIVRAVLPAIVAYLIAKGWPETIANAFAGYLGDAVIAIVMILIAAWAAHRNTQKAQIKKVAQMDGVKEIVVDPTKIVAPTAFSVIEKIKLSSR